MTGGPEGKRGEGGRHGRRGRGGGRVDGHRALLKQMLMTACINLHTWLMKSGTEPSCLHCLTRQSVPIGNTACRHEQELCSPSCASTAGELDGKDKHITSIQWLCELGQRETKSNATVIALSEEKTKVNSGFPGA